MPGSTHERILAAEWLAVMAVETLDALSGADTGSFALPDPSRYFATMVVFLMLAAAAMFGEQPGKLAAAFGGVAGLAIILSPGKEKQAPVVGMLNYFDKLLAGGGSGGPPVVNPSTGLNQYGGTASVSNPEGPANPAAVSAT
jgi:hypothetical protein